MRATVLIATYRRPDFLKTCLAALRKQSRLPDEIVVVIRPEDVASLEVLKQNQELDGDHLKLALVEEPGIVAAENRGLAAATGDIVAMIDDDAEAQPEWLARILGHYSDPEVGAVGGPSVPFVEGRPILDPVTGPCMVKTWYGRHVGQSDRIPDSVRDVHVLRGCNMSFRRNLVGGFDPRLRRYWSRFEDDAILPIHRGGYRVRYDPEIQVYHHIAPVQEGPTRSQDPEAIVGNQHNNTYVTLKHGNVAGNLVFLAFTTLIGDRYNPGILIHLAKGVVEGRPVREFKNLAYGLRGKAAGIGTYWKWRANVPH